MHSMLTKLALYPFPARVYSLLSVLNLVGRQISRPQTGLDEWTKAGSAPSADISRLPRLISLCSALSASMARSTKMTG